MTRPARRLPSLTALRSFEAVARTLSFTRAAAELGVTQAAISRQVSALEAALAVKLVVRGRARNALTDAGEALYSGVNRAFDCVEQAVARISGSGGREILNVSVAPFFSAYWLTPRLASFLRRHPEIDLRLHHSYHPADFRREGIDIGVNWGSGLWPNAKIDLVLAGDLTPVMSPALAPRAGRLAHPRDLLRLQLLYEFDLGDWKAWFEASNVAMPEVDSLRLSDTHALRRMALDGHGVALLFADMLDEDLAAGRLIQPFPVQVNTGANYYLNYPSDSELPSKSAKFKRWILEQSSGRSAAR
ncbi:LysR substrate-binding domain-containing protein [Dongia deserti]|uniref:LysR substrate-binding domain-containing protein n=1 Tax=Dongia deserti TaxID=2268030 RepID=UPI000E647D01|nr:LysR substrate-binding domain-containing protein [Dongia deserti]